MAIMRVNVRPAKRVRWNRSTQRWGRSDSSTPATGQTTEEYANALAENAENLDTENHKITESKLQPSPPDIALQSTSGVVETMFDKSPTLVAIEVTPIETQDKYKVEPNTQPALELLDTPFLNPEQLDAEQVDNDLLDGQIQTGHTNVRQADANPEDAGQLNALKNDSNAAWQKIVWQLMPETPVGRALVAATQRLESSGIDTAPLDAQVILAHILKKDRAWLFAHHEYQLSEMEAQLFTDCIVRRMEYEPVAYLIGCKEFYGLDFNVDSRVLIPRPETELLVDAVLSHLEMRTDQMAVGHQLCVADVGTGCGAIAISVATNAPDVQVYATDISPDALDIARNNIRRLDKRCQVSLLQGDLLNPLQNKVDMHKVDIIAANLPYINSVDYAGLAPDVREYEPQLALEAGPQGLDTIARLLEQAPQHLNPNGVIILEIGYDQGDSVLALVNQLIPDARVVDLRQDYNGKDRLVTIAL